jgi:hypothetical protein
MSPSLLLLSLAWAGPDALLDHQPLPRYLQAEEVQAALEASLDDAAGCLEAAPADRSAAATVSLQIAADGTVSAALVELASDDDALAGCLATTTCSVRFPARDEPRSRWTFNLAARGDELFLLPGLQEQAQPRLPLFLHLPTPDDEQAGEWLAQRLGEQVYPVPPPQKLQACSTKP